MSTPDPRAYELCRNESDAAREWRTTARRVWGIES